ncbi:hypothetical protein TrRE_jg8204 [Triparma retinervis]|uniref:Uncharacterized protein n=1 Tax=Triparma retinervis TaxID=2557542 RepID=A0A9W7E8E2_9STRA|nr:hypothetical protein TrRE_jg8204 [Triparma retinervis]
MGCFSSKAKVAICTGIVTDPKTKARGVIQITCPDNLPSNRKVKVIHVDHGPLCPTTMHIRDPLGRYPADVGQPLYVTFPKTIQEGQVWEYKVEAPITLFGDERYIGELGDDDYR